MSEQLTYQKAGVDPEKAGAILGNFASFLKGRPKDPNILSGIGPYASCYSLKSILNEVEDPILVTCCDGVGTKLKLALEWNDIENLGQDLVGMNVNDLLCAGAKPLLFLDYYACGKLEDAQLTTILRSIQAACEVSQCSLVGGETAEMPGLYSDKDFDLAGFAVGIGDRKGLLGPTKVKVGDRLLAMASSGLHSNGFSLVRKVLEKENVKADARVPFGEMTWREVILKPTTLYVPYLAPRLAQFHALAHITGGGLFENLPRVIPQGLVAEVESKQWAIPPLFDWLKTKASITTEQLLSTFNCGVGMIGVVDADKAAAVERELNSAGLATWSIGVVKTAKDANASRVVWA